MTRLQAYTGEGCRGRKMIARMRDAGVGQVVLRGHLHWKRTLDPWFYDNGAFVDWRHDRTFDGEQFLRDVEALAAMPNGPRFLVWPDRVAHEDSLSFSVQWMRTVGEPPVPGYLAVQNGMVPEHLPWDDIDGVFIGGTVDWKVRTAAQWVVASKRRGLPVHYGRCGTRRRVAHAKALRVDSLDSSLPLWSVAKCRLFLDALAQETWTW